MNETKIRPITVVAFLSGIISVFLYWLLPFMPPVAIILGAVSLSKFNPETDRGKGLAIAGLVLGVLFTLEVVIKLVLGL